MMGDNPRPPDELYAAELWCWLRAESERPSPPPGLTLSQAQGIERQVQIEWKAQKGTTDGRNQTQDKL